MAFIISQENADYVTVCDLVTKDSRASFEQVLNQLEKDDLIATGLQFRQEDYKLQENTDDLAIFYSEASQQYLVMVKEDGLWKIDPKKSDQMNLVNNPGQ